MGGKRGREGKAVNYTSIPCDAPMPQRYLLCYGSGRGPERLHDALWDVQSLPWGWGGGRRGSVAFSALQRFGLKSSETHGDQPVRDKRPPQLSGLCSPSLRVSAPGCSSYSQAELNTRENNSYPSGKKEDQFITRYIIQPK